MQLPGIKNPDEALAIIGKTAVLEFYDVEQFGTPYATQAEALKAGRGRLGRPSFPPGRA